jgi:iron complex outermembrane receptor protein
MPDPIPGTGFERRGASTELYLRDAVAFAERWGAWLGLRHTRLDRGYRQSFTTPWLALSAEVASDTLLYASWGEGVESLVTPNLPGYANAGAPLPAQRGRQVEIGAKGRTADGMQWSAAAFDIRRPHAADTGSDFFIDGKQRHRGVEAQVEGRHGSWQWLAGAMLLHARLPDGSRPPNVPSRTVKAMLARDVAALPGLTLQAWLVAEGNRTLLPQPASPMVGGWGRLDLAARHVQRMGNVTLTWRVGLDNVADRRAWKESPFQFGHAWVYPLAPRAWRASLQVQL